MSNVPNSMMRVMALLRASFKMHACALYVIRYRRSEHLIIVEPHTVAKLFEKFFRRFFPIQILWRKIEHMCFKNSPPRISEHRRCILLSFDIHLGCIHPGYARGSERNINRGKPEFCGAFCSFLNDTCKRKHACSISGHNAEGVRFELTVGCPTPHFKCGALDHSATPPRHYRIHPQNSTQSSLFVPRL